MITELQLLHGQWLGLSATAGPTMTGSRTAEIAILAYNLTSMVSKYLVLFSTTSTWK